MRILKFEACNLFSLYFVQVELSDRGLVLVTGHSKDEGSANGSGKSSIANKGIIWTLFGQTVGGTKGDDVFNRHADKENGCWGEVEFLNAKGERCFVRRERLPSKLTLKKFHSGLNTWRDLSLKTQAETQLFINQLLGRDFKSFIQTDFFGQGREKSFLSLTPVHQVELLEQILPIEELSKWVKYAKEEQKKLKGRIGKVEGELQYKKGSLHQLHKQIIELRDKSAGFRHTREISITQLKRELETYDQSVSEQTSRLSVMRARLADLPAQTPSWLDAVKKHYDDLIAEIRSAKSDQDLCKVTDQQLKVEYEAVKAKLMEVDENCPTCKQPLSREMQEDLMVEQHEIRGRLVQLDKNIEHVKVTLKGWDHHINDLESKLVCSKENYDKAVLVVQHINTVNTEIASIEATLDPEKRDTLVMTLRKWTDAENPHEFALTQQQPGLHNLEEAIGCSEEKLNKLNEEYEHLSFWVETFGKSFKTFLFKRACPFLQSRAAYHLAQLGNEQLKVEFSTSKTLKSGDEKSGFSVHAYSEKGGKGFDNLSGGEQQMVSFAVGLALADLAETQAQGPSHFLILDEPFMALDERNCENLVNYLSNELSSRRETILLISNEDSLKSLISQRIHVEKTGGITCVKQ